MTPSPETSPAQLGHTSTAAPLGTGWTKTLAFSHSLVHLFRSDECRGFDVGWPAPFQQLMLPQRLGSRKIDNGKNVGVTEAK
jgi:hypothetical protein